MSDPLTGEALKAIQARDAEDYSTCPHVGWPGGCEAVSGVLLTVSERDQLVQAAQREARLPDSTNEGTDFEGRAGKPRAGSARVQEPPDSLSETSSVSESGNVAAPSPVSDADVRALMEFTAHTMDCGFEDTCTCGLEALERRIYAAYDAIHETCPDCQHPSSFHNAAGCGIEECGCMEAQDGEE